MKRARRRIPLYAILSCLICAGSSSAAQFHEAFASPPSEARIAKIIHGWPDEPAAQDGIIKSLSTQGFGGIVCNVSFNDYLRSEAKWKAFTRAVEQAKKAGFSLWLYDEKGYPSATAGSLVLQEHPEWQARGLLIADAEVEGAAVSLELPPGTPRLVAAFPVRANQIELDRKTNLVDHVNSGKLAWISPPGRWRVMAITEDRLFEGTHAALSLADHIPYPNLLDPEPTARFIELTHGAYAQHLGDDLSRYFLATFTDEPSLMSLFLKPMPYRVLPWSSHLPSLFQRQHGYSLEDRLPELVTGAGPQTARLRYDYWKTIGSLVSENFFGQIQNWCAAHKTLSGGHLLMEENLVNQVPLYGDFFQCLRRLDAPSIDCLTSLPEQVPWFIARLASSAAELENRSVTMCETSDHSQRYRPAGDRRPVRKVSDREIRGTCNRLMVSGIGTITSYYSFDGLSDAQLRALNEYVGRCGVLLHGGHQVSDIAVVFPVESLWPRFTPARHYANDSPAAAAVEQVFHDVSGALFAAGRDFTYVDARALSQAKVEQGALVHGNLRWRVVILPGADTLPMSAWNNLEKFVSSGGVVISVGSAPANSETEFPSGKVQQLAAKLFGKEPGAEPRVVANVNGGGGIFLPAGAATLLPQMLARVLKSDVQVAEGNTVLRSTHRRIGGQEVFFVINDSPSPWSGTVGFCADGPGEQCDPETGKVVALEKAFGAQLTLAPYGSAGFRFRNPRQPKRTPLAENVIAQLQTTTLPLAAPKIARGEFVREQLTQLPELDATNSKRPAWKAVGTLTKSDVDTFLFLLFAGQGLIDLTGAESLLLETEVPEGQRTPNQLLLMLHEKSGADYLAHTGRLLSDPGRTQTWIPLTRFQLAGWAEDANGRLDPAEISEIRVGWGGYLGKRDEQVQFTVFAPRAVRDK